MTKVHLRPVARRPFVVFWLLLRHAAREFGNHDPLRLGAATAFFATFALPPIVIILIQGLGYLYSASQVRVLLLTKLSHMLGASAAGLVEQILRNVTDVQRSRLVTWLGFTFLLFIATTLFGVIQHSLNQIWQVRVRRRTGQLRTVLKERARSLGLLLATGLLSMLAFLSDAALGFVASYADYFNATVGNAVLEVANRLFSLLILVGWCGVTFRNLSSAKIPRKAVWRGALLTGSLISLGESVLGLLLVPRNLGPIYGPASSIVLVLLFVFYSAMIFYFGACFTKAYAQYAGLDIRPKKSAVRYKLVDVVEEEAVSG
ncbi:YihY/virulence factor BrkB family protein [Hymenobacter terrestris]|uniref:YihY/virulence factor BrkB family protein n=1 Tax=Hymenobacter terrestris TaxID=2748310 RepID=A0ABX2Q2W4_9BACT|nr:YihY/virulence factor BrkB family protein [Hymenobacter terrestris]NVO84059.1 YihY/virulence factor BrkB family protein [Hymenobacter terrestris]